MKKLIEKSELKDIFFDSMTIMVGGFMAVGTPEGLIDEIKKLNIKNITIICNDAGLPDKGVGKLIANNQVSKLIASHIGLNPLAGQKMSDKTMEVILVPQGTLVEQIRSKGAGLGGFLTPTGIGTMVEEGKQIITVNNSKYILEEPVHADFSLLYGSLVDTKGNIHYTKTTRNFNPVMATAGDKVIVEARTIIDEMDPDHVITPHIFTDYIVKEENE